MVRVLRGIIGVVLGLVAGYGCGAALDRGPDACAMAQERLARLDETEGDRVIDSKACVDYEDIEKCPEYQQHRARFDALAAALEPCR